MPFKTSVPFADGEVHKACKELGLPHYSNNRRDGNYSYKDVQIHLEVGLGVTSGLTPFHALTKTIEDWVQRLEDRLEAKLIYASVSTHLDPLGAQAGAEMIFSRRKAYR